VGLCNAQLKFTSNQAASAQYLLWHGGGEQQSNVTGILDRTLLLLSLAVSDGARHVEKLELLPCVKLPPNIVSALNILCLLKGTSMRA
jgi:hypothetical protein